MSKPDTPISKQAPQPRTPGRLAGRVWVAPDFDDTPEDIIAAFEGDADASA